MVLFNYKKYLRKEQLLNNISFFRCHSFLGYGLYRRKRTGVLKWGHYANV